MIAFDEGAEALDGEETPQPPISIAFPPAEVAVGANLMALGLAVMTGNQREGERIMQQLNDQAIALIAISATRRMASALTGDPYDDD